MKFGGRKIKGVSRKFWVIIGSIILGVILLITFMPKEKPFNPFTEPAFPTSELSTLKPDWIEPYISAYGIENPESGAISLRDNYANNLGTPFKMRVFLLPDDQFTDRPWIKTNKFGWTFTPGLFLNPVTPVSPEDVESMLSEDADRNLVVLGFKSNEVPTTGVPYEVTGLLYWNSDILNPPPGDSDYPTTPILLASSARPLAPTELVNPTTNKAKLDISYTQGNYKLDIKHVEWSSGRQIRMCVSLTNVGSRYPIGRWDGLDDFRAEYDQGSGKGEGVAEPDENSSIGNQDEINYGSTVNGYLIFNEPPASSPTDPTKIFIPQLVPDPSEKTRNELVVMPDQFKSTSESSKESGNISNDGCGE